MKRVRKFLVIALIILAIMIAFFVFFFTGYVFGYNEQVRIRNNENKDFLSMIESDNQLGAERLQRWLKHCINTHEKLGAEPIFSDCFKTYLTTEFPLRKESFDEIVCLLQLASRKQNFTKKEIITYLGEPYTDVTNVGKNILEYNYENRGHKYLATIEIVKGSRTTIRVQNLTAPVYTPKENEVIIPKIPTPSATNDTTDKKEGSEKEK